MAVPPDLSIEIPAAMLEAKDNVAPELLSKPGIVGVDVGLREGSGGETTDELAIRVYAPSDGIASQAMLPPDVGSFPIEFVDRSIGTLEAPAAPLPPPVDPTRHEVLVGGIQGVRPAKGDVVPTNGTLGLVVRDNKSGQDLFLSNAHVLCPDEGREPADDEEIVQPASIHPGSEAIGRVKRGILKRVTGFDPHNTSKEEVARLGNTDAAYCDIANRRAGVRYEVAEIGPVLGSAIVKALPLHVQKRGAQTGLTFGLIDGLGLVGEHPSAYLRDSISIKPVEPSTVFSAVGDSGSAVMTMGGLVVGLLWGGPKKDPRNGYAAPIVDTCDQLDVTVGTSPVIQEVNPPGWWVGEQPPLHAVRGIGFDRAKSVHFGTEAVEPVAFPASNLPNSTELAVTPPRSDEPKTVPVRVETLFEFTPDPPFPFVYERIPVVSTLAPDSGPTAGGTTIELKGTALDGVSAVLFGGQAAAIVERRGDSAIVVQTPASEGGAPGSVAVELVKKPGPAPASVRYRYD